MRVIFLDIDGVLNSAAWHGTNTKGPSFGIPDHLTDNIDPAAVDALNEIVNATGAVIILSSSWRGLASISEINRALRYRGICKPLLGITPPDGRPRGVEIQQWLDMAGPAVESFVIIDDDSDMGQLSEFLVQTTWDRGLTKEHAEDAITILLAKARS
jgi:hypothetical protein